VSFVAITHCVASQRVFIVVSVYFVIDSVRKLLDTLPYNHHSFEAEIKLELLSCWLGILFKNGQKTFKFAD
jgi:hypothetical protein